MEFSVYSFACAFIGTRVGDNALYDLNVIGKQKKQKDKRMRFMNGSNLFVGLLSDPLALKQGVETF